MLDLGKHGEARRAANLLLLADGRFPAGGYAHSAGLEQAIERGRVNDEAELREFLVGSLATVGATAASFAAAACFCWRICDPNDRVAVADRDVTLAQLNAEESARMPSAALRTASRAQGRQLLRAAGATWLTASIPKASIVTGGAHLSLAQGLIAAAIDLEPQDAALLSAYSAVTGPATAAVKLLGLDPFAVNRTITSLWPQVTEIVEEASDLASIAPADLPCRTAPLLEIGAEQHLARDLRMFAS